MNDLLISVCTDISPYVQDGEVDLKMRLGDIVGTEYLVKSNISQG